MFKADEEDLLLFSNRFVKQKQYWTDKLSGNIEETGILPDIHGFDIYSNKSDIPGAAEDDKDSREISIPADVSAPLLKLGNNSSLSIFIILLTCLKILIYRYEQGDDITVLSPVCKLKISGETINHCVFLRDRLEPGMTFRELLLKVRETSLEAYENQDYPFDKLKEYLLDLPGKKDNPPVSDIACVLRNIHRDQDTRAIKYTLCFSFTNQQDSVAGHLLYNPKMYSTEFVRQLVRHFTRILAEAMHNFNMVIDNFSFLSRKEKQELVFDFNRTQRSYPQYETIAGLFAARVNKAPDTAALVGKRQKNEKKPGQNRYTRTLTYKELDRQSRLLANLLRLKGVKPGIIVGIAIERSLEMIMALMAIMKAGGGYLPSEPDYPDERLDYMLTDSNAGILATGMQQRIKVSRNIQVIDLTAINVNEYENIPVPGAPQTYPTQPAYIIYTSGTTGKPKGVMIENRSVVNVVCWYAGAYQIKTGVHVLQLSDFTFDASVNQIFGTLLHGGVLHMVPKEFLVNIPGMRLYIEKNQIHVINFVPTLLHELLGCGPPLKSIRAVLCGGERLDDPVKDEIIGHGYSLYNQYGPTECTIDALVETCSHERVLLGTPINNTTCYILDGNKNLMPAGTAGEIYVGGAGVARGYLNRPQLTAEKFQENPFSPGTRMYKTGDLARRLLTGKIEFLGRIDRQVKVRGYRIELEEIETRLLKHHQVKKAVLVIGTEKNSQHLHDENKYLCAYIVPDNPDNPGNPELHVMELKTFLSRELPGYMIPAFFVMLKEIPLTPNGKIDYRALPGKDGSALQMNAGYRAPRNEVENKLTEIWQSVLGRENIGIDDNFFMIGGDSIKSIRIASQMNTAGYRVEMKDLFQHPTISQLAPLVTKPEKVPDQEVVSGNVPLTPIQQYFFEGPGNESHHHNHAVMLFSRDRLPKDGIRTLFKMIQEHHDALRMTFRKENKEIYQTNHGLDYPVSIEEVDLRHRENAPEELEQNANRIQASLVLEKGPLMKVGLFHLDDGDRLLAVIHHLVVDMVSWRILLEDMETLYRQHQKGESPALPLKSDSFKTWAEKLCIYASSEPLLEEADYWKKTGNVEVPPIKRDFPGEHNYMKDHERVSFCLSREETNIFLARVHKPFSTDANDILLTALGLALKKKYGNNHLLIDLEGHGREEIIKGINVTRTVGWFTSCFPVVLDFSYETDLTRQIKEVKETLHRIPHKGIGYGILKYLTPAALKEETGIDFQLAPQICFNYLGQFDEDVNQRFFELAREPVGQCCGLKRETRYEFNITGQIIDKRLEMSIDFNKNHYKQETIKQLWEWFQSGLLQVISFCQGIEKPEPTPCDFMYHQLDIREFDRLFNEVDEKGEKNILSKTNIREIYPLSPMQEGMFFYTLYEPTSLAYHIQSAYRLRGEFDIAALEKSLCDLFARYDILRTAFVQTSQKPLQVVLKKRQPVFYYEDISNREDKDAYIAGYKEKDKKNLFKPGKDVLMRLAVFRLEEALNEFVWTSHHILMDGWCTGILISDFFEIYNSYREKREPRLAAVKPYKHYIQWLETQNRKESRNYWSAYLKGCEQLSTLPYRKKFQELNKNYLDSRLVFKLERRETALLEKIAARNQVTMNILMQSTWGIILGRYNNSNDAVFGAVVSGRPAELEGVEAMVGLFINTIPVRVRCEKSMTFQHLLQRVKQGSISSEPHHYFPLAEIQSLTSLKQNLFDHIMAFENFPTPIKTADGQGKDNIPGIHLEPVNRQIFEQTNYDFNIGIIPGKELIIDLNYNENVYPRAVIENIARHLRQVVSRVINDEKLKIKDISLLSIEERQQLLVEFNDTASDYPGFKTIHELFEEQARKHPQQTAVSSLLSLDVVYEAIEPGKLGVGLNRKLAGCCFKKNPYIFKFENSTILPALKLFPEKETRELIMLHTHKLNYAVVSKSVLLLLDYFDGENNIESLFKGITGEDTGFLIYHIEKQGEESDFRLAGRERIIVDKQFDFSRMVLLIKALHQANLIEPADYHTDLTELNVRVNGDEEKCHEESTTAEVKTAFAGTGKEGITGSGTQNLAPVLLLGDRTGPATTGLLYIASFLRRNGIEAYCRWNDLNANSISLKNNLETLLAKIRPGLVGVSMKWFPHIARVLEICKIIKEYDPSIIVVVGGNTASYYSEEIIQYQCIDYVIMGDGEIPLLKLCRGDEHIPNLVYKKQEETIRTPITYVQDEEKSAEIYLSHMDEIFVSKKDPYLASCFYINTGKGCTRQCVYCAGCRQVQEKTFNRVKPFIRGVKQVRSDIMAAKKYVSSFLFDLDLLMDDPLDYFKKVVEGIDLSSHFASFTLWRLPNAEFLDFMVRTFAYVCINISMCDLSGPHRQKLVSLGLVKPQPTDEELFSFFDRCETYDNLEVVINQIAGLPYFSLEDIQQGRRTLAALLNRYSFFNDITWGRLHAQPGALIIDACEKHHMHTSAKNFVDFLHYSKLNWQENQYPVPALFNYPYIETLDRDLHAEISKYYMESNLRIEKYKEQRRKKSHLDFNDTITYAQLEEKARWLAGILLQKGAKPGTVIGVMLERSPGMIMALLAILKAGCAYLPIDPNFPPERIAFMLKDSNAHMLISQEDLLLLIKIRETGFQGQVIDIFAETVSFPGSRKDQPPVERRSVSTDPAYVIYTSGSTGKPKGVIIDHKNVVRLVKNTNYIDLRASNRLLLTGNIIFDITTFEIWGTLLNGLNLVLVDQAVILDAKKLKAVLREYRVNILHLVPQLLEQLVSEPGGAEIFAGLDYLLVGGDLVKPAPVNKTRKACKNLRVLHMYGPTENTTFSTFFLVDKEYETAIPIGKPIDNSTVYIVDMFGALQPIGVPGELLVGGEGLARGYLNNPGFTVEKFIHGKSLFTDSPVYKTGDLARWQPGGNLEFLGRLDFQVKIRGIRIELGEIENQLQGHEDIKEALVVLRDGNADEQKEDKNKYLCAYIVTGSGKELPTQQLREFILEKLPGYMMPAYFVCLKEFPLTPGGKIDRNRLQSPLAANSSRSHFHQEPRGEVEEKLVEIWRQVLGRDHIGIDEDFFTIGGDSIKALRISSKMRSAGYSLEIKEIFQNPTISQLAPRLNKVQHLADQSPISGPVPLTPIQEIFFRETRVEPNHNNLAVLFSSPPQERFDPEALGAVFGKIQEHHDALRMTFKKEKGVVVQWNHGKDFPLSLEVHDLRNSKNQRQLLEHKADKIQAGIDLEKGPLMKLGLFHPEDGDRLLIVIHHLVIDGVSWRILLEDIDTLYRQFLDNQPLHLPLKSTSFKSWAEKLTVYANSKEFLKEKSYWTRLESMDVPPLKKDFNGPDNRVEDTESLCFNMNEEDTTSLLTKVNQAFGTEVNDILLTALGLALKQSTGNDRFLIALEGHGREGIFKHVDVSRTIGWFTSIFPVWLDVSGDSPADGQIKKTKEYLRNIPHHGIGYGILEYITTGKNKKGMIFKSNPQIRFNYLGQFDQDIKSSFFKIAKESPGRSSGQREQRQYDIEVSGIIMNQQLQVTIIFNKKHFKSATIQSLADNFENALKDIITLASGKEEKELTPSDLTYKNLSMETLEQLNAAYPLEDVYPLTPMQEGMLFHALFEKEAPGKGTNEKQMSVYFSQSSFRLHGQLNISLVEKSINQLLKRHPVLRSIFVHEGLDRPLQLVLKNRRVDFHYENIQEKIQATGAGEKIGQSKYIEACKQKDRLRPFDPGKDVMMRITVIQTEESVYEFTWSYHHILMDGWCMGILIKEFFQVYNSFLENSPVELPPAPPYRQFITWLEKRSEKKDRQASGNYWKKYLESYRQLSAIPGIKAHYTNESAFQKESVTFLVEEENAASLNRLAVRNRVTLNTVIRSAWGILLGIYNNRQDVVFGAVVSGRPAELERVDHMIGLFINTIPVRIRFNGNMSFDELLQKIQQEAIDNESHHHYPLVEIQSKNPLKQHLFDHIIGFENFPAVPNIEGLNQDPGKKTNRETLKISNLETLDYSNYNFVLVVVAGETLKISFEYNSHAYEKESVQTIAAHFKLLLDQVARKEKIFIHELTLLSEQEKSKLVKSIRQKKGRSITHVEEINQESREPLHADFDY